MLYSGDNGGDDVTQNDSDRDECANWEPPQRGEDSAEGSGLAGKSATVDGDSSEDAELKPPTELRDPLLRDQIRDHLEVTPQQWYVIETLLLVSPYPVFIFIYLTIDINEMAFLIVTLVYSLVATYVGLLS